ncbi:hypothetical protein QBC35DRAFT_448391 [Podospora australis]|uniref:Uncharacterized protein n=1 Tax=Podospora australis TaxID=1536484 RepID=A0AAN7AN31_9PEZI|nr:hypothetical protein QBC35DRAFT_448391 [Podospora australis]
MSGGVTSSFVPNPLLPPLPPSTSSTSLQPIIDDAVVVQEPERYVFEPFPSEDLIKSSDDGGNGNTEDTETDKVTGTMKSLHKQFQDPQGSEQEIDHNEDAEVEASDPQSGGNEGEGNKEDERGNVSTGTALVSTNPVGIGPSASNTAPAPAPAVPHSAPGPARIAPRLEKKWKCLLPGCENSDRRDKDSLVKHLKKLHNRTKMYQCIKEGCPETGDNGYGTLKELCDHWDDDHRESLTGDEELDSFIYIDMDIGVE